MADALDSKSSAARRVGSTPTLATHLPPTLLPVMSKYRYAAQTSYPDRPAPLSANGQWIFGSIFGFLLMSGLAFGVWLGAAKPKVIEVAEKPKANSPTDEATKVPPLSQPSPTPQPTPAPAPQPPLTEPKPQPPAKPSEPQPQPKIQEPEPKPKEPEPKKMEVKAVSFKQVEPILRAYCNNCHGAAGRAKGGVDLTTLAAIRKGGRGGDPIIVPGDPEKSPLYESITSGRMPDEGRPPPPKEQLEIIKNWILSGCKERRRVIRRRPSPA
jgi:protein TonB